MNNAILIEAYISELDTSVSAASGVYAILMTEDNQALNPSSGLLQSFVKANQNVHGMALPQHSERTRYFTKTLPASGMTLPANPSPDRYTIEYWTHVGTGNYNRDSDTLFDVESIYWNGTKVVSSPEVIGITSGGGGGGSTQWNCYLSMGYDSVTQTVSYTAWLEKDGEVVTNPISCQIIWLDRLGSPIANITNSSPTIYGYFMFTQAAVVLLPDISTFAIVKITDADVVVHTSGIAPVTWD